MRAYDHILRTVPLFAGMDAAGREKMLTCLGAVTRQAARGEILLLAGDKPRHVGIVLTGRLHVLREDLGGNRSLVAAVTPGELFAEALCCADVAESPVTVVADTDAVVLLLAFPRALRTCPEACAHHAGLVANMLKLVAGKTLLLQRRLELIGLRSVRARVLRYLETLAPGRGERFAIPFNREEMADHLCVERSALSHELARMRRDGLLDYRKNVFTLHESAADG